jgi:hypothetical protein
MTHSNFLTLVKVIEEYGGPKSLTHFPNMIKKELLSDNNDVTNATANQMKKAKRMCGRYSLQPLYSTGLLVTSMAISREACKRTM